MDYMDHKVLFNHLSPIIRQWITCIFLLQFSIIFASSYLSLMEEAWGLIPKGKYPCKT